MADDADLTPDDRKSVYEKQRLEIENLRHTNAKLLLEILQMQPMNRWFVRWLAVLSPLAVTTISFIGLGIGAWQYLQKQETERLQSLSLHDESIDQKLDEQRREINRSFWEKQFALYMDASEAAATVATSGDKESREKAASRFWVLYWGPLAAVEDVRRKPPEYRQASKRSGAEQSSVQDVHNRIEETMVNFGEALRADAPQHELKHLSLQLAHAVREAISPKLDANVLQSENLRGKE
jgi:hypothetical protein